MKHNGKRFAALLLALALILSQSASALAYAVGTWPGGYEAAGCPSEDALIRNDGKHWYNCTEYVEPWCETSGYTVFTCVYCGDTQTRTVPAMGHEWSEWDENGYPTCTEPGGLIRFCRRCQATDTQTIPALGHDWGDWQTLNDASCSTEGMEIRFCRRCQMEQTRVIAALNHNWGPWRVEYPGTCVERGMEVRSCMNCGVEEYRYTGYGDHNWGEWETVKAPTATEPGVEQRYCKNAPTHIEEREIPPTGQMPDPVPGVTVAPIPADPNGALTGGGEGPSHSMTMTVSWDEGIGEGKRYEGAVIPLYFTSTNTGEIPIFLEETELQPGESLNETVDWEVRYAEMMEGVVHSSGHNYWYRNYDFQDAEGNWLSDRAYSNEVVIPLTYPTPSGTEPEPDKPELTLTFLYDKPAKDVYDPEENVFAYYSLVNTGNIPLHVVAHFTAEGVEDYDVDRDMIDPGEADRFYGWGWVPVREGITPNTETEDLLGTVNISIYYRGLDVNTGKELCRTQPITRVWEVGKPDEGPSSWHIPSLSDITAVLEVKSGYESSDPAGYQLGEWFGAILTVTNTGDSDIPAGTINVYDPYDGFTDTWSDFDFNVGDTVVPYWTPGLVFTEDVERGYIYFPPVEFTWEDPDSGEEMHAYSNSLTLPVISKTGLLIVKSVAEAPANGDHFTEGEEIKWAVTVTNTSDQPIMNVIVTDQNQAVGEFEKLEPGETVVCSVPLYTVTEYDALVGFVSNAAEAKGTDPQNVEHTYMSNTVQVPIKAGSPVSLPPSYVPEKDPDPSTGTPQKATDPSKDPGPTSGTPETPGHPGTPGGGEDPKGPIYGYNVAATLYKTTAHGPKNGEYYKLGETIDYVITLTNTGKTPLENITLIDSLAGFKPIASAASLAPAGSVDFKFSYTITQKDIDRGYVVNAAIVLYTFGSGIHGTPVVSNLVYVKAGENGWIPGPGITSGGKPGGPGGSISGDLIPPVHFEKDKLTGAPGGEGPVSCELQMDALGDSGADYTLHACAAHTDAAKNAEAAAMTGDWSKACDIWSAEIETLYEALYEASDSEGKAAVVSDRAAFNAYANAFRALMGDENAAEMLQLYCAELCCMSKTAPERMPNSLLNDCAILKTPAEEQCAREVSALMGSDMRVTERYDAEHAELFQEAVRLAKAARYGTAQENAFNQTMRRWQIALDSMVNAQYKAADKETRKLIAAARTALDGVYEARKGLLELLYAEAPEMAAEALSNLYRNALIDFCGR